MELTMAPFSQSCLQLIQGSSLAQCLTHREYSVTVSCYYPSGLQLHEVGHMSDARVQVRLTSAYLWTSLRILGPLPFSF